MECRHHPGRDADRDRLRPAHRDWGRTGGAGLVSVLAGSALWTEAGAGCGHWGLIEAVSADLARRFAEGDPFATGGVVAVLTLTRMADGFAADRISPRLTLPDR